MATKKLSNEFMEAILEEACWKSISEKFPLTEDLLEKYNDKLNWELISENSEIIWSPSMLDKFKKCLNWTKFSSSRHPVILNIENIERYKECWNWSELSLNRELILSYDLIDKFINYWDWEKLINRYFDDAIYSIGFLEKYLNKIPVSKLQDSTLWEKAIEQRTQELSYEIIL